MPYFTEEIILGVIKGKKEIINKLGSTLLIGVEDNGNIIGLTDTNYPTFKD